jgi:hypothetical protein
MCVCVCVYLYLCVLMKILFHVRVLSTLHMTKFLRSSTISELYDHLVIMNYALSFSLSLYIYIYVCVCVCVPNPWGETHFTVFCTRYEMRMKKQLSIEHIIESSTSR